MINGKDQEIITINKTGNSISGKRTARQEKNVPEPWSDSRDFFVHFMPLTLLEK